MIIFGIITVELSLDIFLNYALPNTTQTSEDSTSLTHSLTHSLTKKAY